MTIAQAVKELGEEGFVRRMEDLSSAERREIFAQLHVPPGGASASARQRNLRRIRLAWGRLAETGDETAAEMFARSWLGRARMPMIIEFLDRFSIPHQGGYLEDVTALEKLPGAEVRQALEDLGRTHGGEDARLYAALMSLPQDEAAADAAG